MNSAICQPTTRQSEKLIQSIIGSWSEYNRTADQLRGMLQLRENEWASWDQRQELKPRVKEIIKRLQMLQDNDPWGVGTKEDARDVQHELRGYLIEIKPLIVFLQDESQSKKH